MRRTAPRSSHAQWDPPDDRPDPVSILEEQARTRVPDLVPIRYGRMIASAFGYFRGAAAPMAWDLARTPTSGIRVQACGDAHLLNFGMFAAPDRRLVFDVNDFDETLPAPFEWDVKRLAASFAVAARDKEFSEREARAAARTAVRSYRTEMANYAAMRFLKVWYSRIDVDEVTRLFDALQPRSAVRRRRRDIADAQRRTSLKAFLKMCDQVEGQYRIRPAHPVITRYPIERHPEMLAELRHAIALYQETMPGTAARFSAATTSATSRARSSASARLARRPLSCCCSVTAPDEPLFLQLKEAQESVLAPFAGKSEFKHQGERVVRGQQLTQAASDPFLGWTTGTGTIGSDSGGRRRGSSKEYYVRQLRDMKGSMSVSAMDPHQLSYYGRLCGWALARAHARTGRATMISGYLGGGEDFDHAIADFAVAYAEQNERDYRRLLGAVSAAEVQATVDM